MTKRDALSVSVKVLGLVWLYKAAFILAMMFPSGQYLRHLRESRELYKYLAMGVVDPLLFFAIGLASLRWGNWLAAKLVRREGESPLPASSGQERSIFVLAMRVVGVVYLTIGSAWVAGSAANAVSVRSIAGFLFTERYGVPALTFGIAMIAFGVYLLAGGRHLAAFASREPKSHAVSRP